MELCFGSINLIIAMICSKLSLCMCVCVYSARCCLKLEVINAKVSLTDRSHTMTFSQTYTTAQEPVIPRVYTTTHIHRAGLDVRTALPVTEDFTGRTRKL